MYVIINNLKTSSEIFVCNQKRKKSFPRIDENKRAIV